MNQMFRMFSEAMCLPITTFATGMETMARTMQCGDWMQRGDCSDWSRSDRDWSCSDSSDRDWDRACGGRDYGSGSDDGWSGRGRSRHDDDKDWGFSINWGDCGCGCGCGRCRQGDCCGSSGRRCNLVKLVEYTVVSVRRGGRRDEERAEMKQRVITDCTSMEEFRNEVLIDYARDHKDSDGKYLRVYLRVLACWRKEDFDFEEDQLHALHEIRHSIDELRKQREK